MRTQQSKASWQVISAACLFSLVAMYSPFATAAAPVKSTEIPEVQLKAAADTHQPIRLKPGKPQLVRLNAEVGGVEVDDMDANLAAFSSGPQTVALFPKKPGGAHVVIRGRDGTPLMSRYVFISPPDQKYIRVREAAVAGHTPSGNTRVYYCPNLCYETYVVAPPAGE